MIRREAGRATHSLEFITTPTKGRLRASWRNGRGSTAPVFSNSGAEAMEGALSWRELLGEREDGSGRGAENARLALENSFSRHVWGAFNYLHANVSGTIRAAGAGSRNCVQ